MGNKAGMCPVFTGVSMKRHLMVLLWIKEKHEDRERGEKPSMTKEPQKDGATHTHHLRT